MVRRIVVGVLVAYLLICLFAMWYENRLIYPALKYPVGEWNPPYLAPEDVYFKSLDGTPLHGWYVRHPAPSVHILYCHGNGGNITHRAFVLQYLRDRFAASVFIFDYRGYGKSEGRPSERGVLKDGRAARAWLAEAAQIDETDVVLMGRSLGGAVAVDLAAEKPPRGMILESTFTTMPDVAAHHYPYLPVRLLLRTKFDSLSKIAAYRGPLLQSHAPDDEVIPFELGHRLFDEAGGDKQFIALEGLTHNDPQSPEYYEAFARLIEKLPPVKRSN